MEEIQCQFCSFRTSISSSCFVLARQPEGNWSITNWDKELEQLNPLKMISMIDTTQQQEYSNPVSAPLFPAQHTSVWSYLECCPQWATPQLQVIYVEIFSWKACVRATSKTKSGCMLTDSTNWSECLLLSSLWSHQVDQRGRGRIVQNLLPCLSGRICLQSSGQSRPV